MNTGDRLFLGAGTRSLPRPTTCAAPVCRPHGTLRVPFERPRWLCLRATPLDPLNDFLGPDRVRVRFGHPLTRRTRASERKRSGISFTRGGQRTGGLVVEDGAVKGGEPAVEDTHVVVPEPLGQKSALESGTARRRRARCRSRRRPLATLGVMAVPYSLHRWPVVVAPGSVLGGLVVVRVATEAMNLPPTSASAWSSPSACCLAVFISRHRVAAGSSLLATAPRSGPRSGLALEVLDLPRGARQRHPGLQKPLLRSFAGPRDSSPTEVVRGRPGLRGVRCRTVGLGSCRVDLARHASAGRGLNSCSPAQLH